MPTKRQIAGIQVPAARQRPPTSALPAINGQPINAALKPPKRPAGFGGQTREQRQEAGRLGGRHRAQRGAGHQFRSTAEASAAGKKGRAKQIQTQQQAPAKPKAR